MRVTKRIWTRRGPSGHRVKKIAWGYTLQVPCNPCPHRDKKTGKVLHPNGVRQIREFNSSWSKEDAQDELSKRVLGVKEEQAKANAPMTFGEAVERYEKEKTARKKSIAFDKAYRKDFKAAFGAATPLVDITAARISAWKAEKLAAKSKLGRPYSAAAINRPLATLRHLLQLAHEEWEVLPTVPRIRLEKEPQGRIRWLEPDEEKRLLEVCTKSKNPELVPIGTIALESGLRRSELLGLTWERVDLSRGVIRLEVTKSGRRREVPMRQAVYDTLAVRPEPREGRVFKTQSIRTAFENAVEAAKLEDFHLHDTRHHFASWFVMRGGSLQALKEILGHASLSMTLRYAHLAPDHLRTEIAKMERRAAPALSIPSTQEAADGEAVRSDLAGTAGKSAS